MLTGVVGNGSRLQERESQPASQCLWRGECSGRSLVLSVSEFATGRFSFGVSHSVLLFESGKKINKNTRHYNPKMFLPVLIFQYLALHKCATLLIKLLNKAWAGNSTGQMPI